MRRLLVILLLAVGLVPVAGGTAWACSCGGAESEAARYREIAARSQAVYVGTVLEQTRAESGETAQGAQYRIRVDRALKGAVVGTERTVTDHGGSCGSQIKLGRAFIPEDPGGRLHSCSGVNQFDVDGEADRYLRYNRALPETGPPLWLAATGAALLLGAAVARRRVGA